MDDQKTLRAGGVPGRVFVPIMLGAILLLTAGAILLFKNARHAFDYGTKCELNLKAIGIALTAYQEAHGTLPPAFVADREGRHLHSWRVLLLPFLKEKDAPDVFKLYQFDKPWNAPENQRIQQPLMPIVYHCPSRERAAEPVGAAHFLALTGPNTAWPGNTGRKVAADPNLMLLVEVMDDGVGWFEPRDIKIDELTPGPASAAGVGGSRGAGPLALYADGSVKRLPPDVTTDAIQKAAQAELPPRNGP